MSTLANSEDPDEMPHNAAFHQGLRCLLNYAAFHQGLRCLLRQKRPSEKEIHFIFFGGGGNFHQRPLDIYNE